MREFLTNSVYFGVIISLAGYILGLKMNHTFKSNLCNPLLISIIFVMTVLAIFRVDYDNYNSGAKILSYMLTPATVCLAIPLYQQLELLKKNIKAVFFGILAGMFSSLISVLALAYLFRLSHEQYVTLLPKSITTAIGFGISEELGGITTITVAVIIITGVLGNMIAEMICKIFRIHHPVAVGLALGTSAHAIGTAKALEIGEIEGAMSSLSIAVCGLLTVIGASVFANFL
ncbi:LrgB family protein [Anaerocolumna sp. AGMB13025]|uniref:LrgB family protein n=1 Tax=Anaerocolumna sp. AGMB13025 TaxID=3039116 RepID=UPI00241F5483|nr:LrgB family protein [Anaerocolumna sp. AGMB13025]WFR58773.1 LrgB family protein [Anaerocolumna sp. AGMB13025]